MTGTPIPFIDSKADKEHALKPLEEAAEVFGDFQNWYKSNGDPDEVLDECADVIQAIINFMYGMYLEETGKEYNLLNMQDFYEWVGHYINRCNIRNMERGRI